VQITGAGSLALRASGSQTAFEHGDPLRATSCGAPATVPSGTHVLIVSPGPLAVDQLELASPAPRPPAVSAAVSGRVLAPGTTGRGSYDHVRVAVRAPSWLVLGEGYDRGWRAWCDGRSLGAPVPIDGYANGWPVGPGCRQVHFAFAPNRLAEIGYIVSGVAGLLCLVVLAVAAWRRRRSTTAHAAGALAIPSGEPVAPWPLGRSALAAVPSAALFGFVFGLTAGFVSLPVIAVCLWRGVGARRLTLAAGALLGIVVPVLYLVHPGDERGGNHFAYAMVHIAAHWVGVAALGLLTGALWRSLRALGTTRRPPAGRPPAESPGA
jgi:hypothetical protein